ncbi:fumarate reductase flavo protein subunit precursor [Lophiostoma macrostomum CBS 122681]|uniref:Fumarate reductase flavo protein subunit n=1 Tax=Lophiostoma macrostomum CBS 122681 TaxID=1314788 RepID=A0A6A6T045_9PLEO|nr:fumarate reductase flavo protein subunit precursor [Lophiostoma macrostomum CBS 122681]
MSSLSSSRGIDVLVVGGGNAGFTAATTAAESGAGRVVLIDKCPEEWAGGNSYFTAGAFRTVHSGTKDLLPIVNNVDAETAKIIDMEPYTPEDFREDMDRLTSGRSDPELSKILIEESNSAVKWLAKKGIRFQLSFNRQAYKVNGRYTFWGGMSLKTDEGGKGLIADHQAAASKLGVEVYYSTPAKHIIAASSGSVTGVVVEHEGQESTISTKAVILAAGGFEANPRMRSQFLGPGWDLARVRGTPFNTGDALEFAMRDVNAKQFGHWSGCHSTCWDANAPANSGDRIISNEFTKSGYPLGLMVNNAGKRFVDEGIDLRNYTYAKFGRAVHEQPDGVAFQIWDQRTIPWLRAEEYRDEVVHKVWGSTIEELAQNLAVQAGLDAPDTFVQTLDEYNKAVYAFQKENPDKKWDPAVKDGLSTQSSSVRLTLGKTNWALPLDQGPFMAVKVCCGVTFTFGGLAVNPQTTAVISQSNLEIPGLFCVGEMLGGLFYGNYPGGSGLTSGTVFGRRAGVAAAKLAASISGGRSMSGAPSQQPKLSARL